MVQGTSSSVGKSLLVTALCRIYARQGLRVAPFKAQNMSNNAAVCADGAEIGRAQAVQAIAAGIEPTAEMNPVLLKPEADARSQVIVMGRPWRSLAAGEYYQHKEYLWSVVTKALGALCSRYDLVVIEGAGSPAEINLRPGDIVNMAVARYVRAPVLLAGDIDRGGIFAQLLGTLWLLAPEERNLVRGLVVNKFRGDLALFAAGVRMLEERGGVPVLGVVPYLRDLDIPEEDAVALEQPLPPVRSLVAPDQGQGKGVDVVVIRLPRIANFDDFDPLAREPGVQVRYVASPDKLGRPHAIIVPGTKSTTADLSWLWSQGLAGAIQDLASEGTAVVGICGGYQMLGRIVRDPDHVESSLEEAEGLSLLPVETTFAGDKATCQTRARVLGGPTWLAALAGQTVHGYEIHMGRTVGSSAWLSIEERHGVSASDSDGAVSADGRVWGTYMHGLFQNATFRRAWLGSLHGTGMAVDTEDSDAAGKGQGPSAASGVDRLADAVQVSLDMDQLKEIIWGS
ncbi:MAG: cobyric acid synthase [Chloroflexota bacterium]|nr:cobyric acid synthase [Chloroflexota bacterium]